MESQPAAEVSYRNKYCKCIINIVPVISNWLVQMVTVVVSLNTALTFKISVAIESQLAALVRYRNKFCRSQRKTVPVIRQLVSTIVTVVVSLNYCIDI